MRSALSQKVSKERVGTELEGMFNGGLVIAASHIGMLDAGQLHPVLTRERKIIHMLTEPKTLRCRQADILIQALSMLTSSRLCHTHVHAQAQTLWVPCACFTASACSQSCLHFLPLWKQQWGPTMGRHVCSAWQQHTPSSRREACRWEGPRAAPRQRGSLLFLVM